MEGRIAHLRSHYRLAGAQVAAPAIASRLDRVLREEVIRNYGEALESALAGDESVYVLRRVKVRTRMLLSDDLTDAELAKRWGVHLATAVMRAIARGEDDPGNVVRFENQADYVAGFLVALLKGTHQTQWFYEAFSAVDALDKNVAIRRVLLDNISDAPAILACVHRAGELESLIANLDEETKRALWSPQSEQRDDLEVSRSLFSTALQFLEQLGGWNGPSRNSDDLFQSYLRTSPPFADWRDPRSLAEYVFEVVRYFFARGYLAKRNEASELLIWLDEALENFEWLDREWLKDSVRRLFEKEDWATPELPLRAASGRATPRQRELLGAIASAVGEASVVSVDESRLSAALKLLALLVDAAPGWADDTAAKVMIDNLLTVCEAMRLVSAREEFVKRLQCRDVEGALRLLVDAERARGRVDRRNVETVLHSSPDDEPERAEVVSRDVEEALHLLPTSERERVKVACRAVAGLGEPALALLEKLCDTETKALVNGVESECAGVSLLLRTFFDARLHALVDEDAFPVTSPWSRSAMLFVAIALRLSGDEKAFVNGALEPGICLLAGMEEAPAADALNTIWREAESADHSKFQEVLLRIAAAHRLQDSEDDSASTLDGLIEPLDFLDSGKTGNPKLDQSIATVTCLLLRMWARWLHGFSNSSPAFLVEHFFHRPGRLYTGKDVIHIELEQRPLDVVMEMAGYLADLERVPWLPGKRIKFSLKGS